MRATERFTLLSDTGDDPPPRGHRRRPGWRLPVLPEQPARLVAIGAAGALAVALLLAMLALDGSHTVRYTFRTLDNPAGPAFNLLLGINNGGVIAGAFGSGTAGHPSRGYLLLPGGQGDYVNENFPGAAQTQVTGLNDRGVTVGFWARHNNANWVNREAGFYAIGATSFHPVNFPTTFTTRPAVNQLLGVNDHGVAVGFWTNGADSNQGYEFSISNRHFSRVLVPGAAQGRNSPSLIAAAINDHGAVAGFYTAARGGVTDAFLKLASGRFIKLAYPGAAVTKAFGVSDSDEVVGAYTAGTGKKARTHGFTWTPGQGFTTVDDPHGVGATVVNGVNNAGDLVGFYADGKGSNDGMLAVPRR
jgi:hypothetical protein